MTVKYFSSTERTIFLHFLNREACEACKVPHDFVTASAIIEMMTIAHCSRMAVNISQLIEYCGNNARFLSDMFALADAGLVIFISSAQTIDEFIASRRKIYEHDRVRYPMYFDDTASFTTGFKIGQINTTSTTTVLARKIFDWGDDLLDPVNRVMNKSDQNVARENRDLIQQLTMQGRERAVTRAMYRGEYSGKRLSPEASAVAGRMISGIYIDQYRSEYEYAQCCGVPGLEYFDQYKWFPHYDYQIISDLCKLLGYDEIKRRNRSAVRHQRNSLYGSDEHRTFVGWFHVLVDCVFHYVISQANNGKLSAGNLQVVREQLKNVIFGLNERVGPRLQPIADLKDFYYRGADTIKQMGKLGCALGVRSTTSCGIT